MLYWNGGTTIAPTFLVELSIGSKRDKQEPGYIEDYIL